MSSFVLSLIRTWVPVAVGFLIAWGLLPATLSDQAVAAFSALLTAAYYLIVRLLESRWPALGWLLGAPKTPTYPGSSG